MQQGRVGRLSHEQEGNLFDRPAPVQSVASPEPMAPVQSGSTLDQEPEQWLEARQSKLALDENVNKVQLVSAQGPGFYCALCDRAYPDNVSYLDHLNGERHLKNSGLTLRLARATVDQVKARLKELGAAARGCTYNVIIHNNHYSHQAKRLREREGEGEPARDALQLLKESVARAEQQATLEKEMKKQRRKEKKAQAKTITSATADPEAVDKAEDEDEVAMRQLMGFGSFK